MAAILCGGCGDCLKGICTCSSGICTKGCDVCNKGCASCCKGCDGICDICGKGCSGICEGICKVISFPFVVIGNACRSSGPFCIYLTVALGLNIPPIVIGITSLSSTFSCPNNQSAIWLLVNLLFCACNVAAAIYLAHAISDERFTTLVNNAASASGNNRRPPPPADSTSFNKLSYLMCYDVWIAFYILGLVAFFAWIFVGFMWWIVGSLKAGNLGVEGCADSSNVLMSLGFDVAFVILGFLSFVCSMCLSCFHSAPASTAAPSSSAMSSPVPEPQSTKMTSTPAVAVAVPIETATTDLPPMSVNTGLHADNNAVEVPFADEMKR